VKGVAVEVARRMLLVPPTSDPSGVVTYVLDEAEAIGDGCTVLGARGSALADSLPVGSALLPAGVTMLEMARVLAAHRNAFDFVLAHGPRAIAASTLAAIPSARLGYTFHEVCGPHARAELLLARRALAAANAPETAAWVRKRLGIDVDVLPPVVGPRRGLLSASAARGRLNVTDGELVVGVIGRLSAVKYPVLAVEAVAESGLDATLMFLGDGPERAAILEAGTKMGVRVALPGVVRDAASLTAGFDVVLSCSPLESFGLAAAEAIMAGTPVVAVDSPGLRLLTDSGRLQNLCPARADALGQALAKTVGQPRDSRALREFIGDAFGPKVYATRLAAYLKRADARALRS
jgi:glycosyltransferase involved in cell wall biosynthesis